MRSLRTRQHFGHDGSNISSLVFSVVDVCGSTSLWQQFTVVVGISASSFHMFHFVRVSTDWRLIGKIYSFLYQMQCDSQTHQSQRWMMDGTCHEKRRKRDRERKCINTQPRGHFDSFIKKMAKCKHQQSEQYKQKVNYNVNSCDLSPFYHARLGNLTRKHIVGKYSSTR